MSPFDDNASILQKYNASKSRFLIFVVFAIFAALKYLSRYEALGDFITGAIAISPFILLLSFFFWSYLKDKSDHILFGQLQKHDILLKMAFKLSLSILILFIAFFPAAWLPMLRFLEVFRALFSLEMYFFFAACAGVILLASGLIIFFIRLYQAGRGTYTLPIRELVQKNLYVSFFAAVFLFFFSFFVYPRAFYPLTDALSDALFTLSQGGITLSKLSGADLQKADSLFGLAKHSLSQASRNLLGELGETKTSLTETLNQSKEALTESINATSENLTASINEKVSSDGGEITGDLTLSGSNTDLTVEGTTTTRDIIPNENLSYNLGDPGKSWNTIYAHRLIGASPIFIGTSNSEQGLSATGDLIVSNDLEVQGSLFVGDYFLPQNDGETNQILRTNGSGTLSWASVVSGTAGQLQFSGGDALAADSELYWDNSSKRLGVGTSSPQAKVEVTGTVRATAFFLSDLGVYLNPNDVNSNYWTEDNGDIYRETGKIGIGTDNPAETLSLDGRMELRATTAPGTTTNRLWNTSGDLYWNGLKLGENFWTKTGNDATFNLGGQVGIGKSPTTKLDVLGTVKATNFFDTESSVYLTPSSINGNYWGESGGHIFRETGNVGIGTTSSSGMMHIYSTGDTVANIESNNTGSDTVLNLKAAANSLNRAYLTFGMAGATTWNVGILKDNTPVSASLSFSSMGSLKSSSQMVITIGGNVGIGTTEPVALLDAAKTFTNTSGTVMYTRPTINVTSSGTYSTTGLLSDVSAGAISNGVTNSGTLYALRLDTRRMNAADAGTLVNLIGALVQYGNGSTAASTVAITNAFGVKILPNHQKGNIENSYALYLQTATTGGTATNYYGLYQQDATAKNYFAGNVGIGTTEPSAQLTLAKADSSGLTDFLVNPTVKTGGNLLNLQVGGVARLTVDMDGFAVFRRTVQGTGFLTNNGLQNSTSINYAYIGVESTGIQLRRNSADSVPVVVIKNSNAGSTGDILQLQNNVSTVLSVQQNGNVGIGTTRPEQALQVAGNILMSDAGIVGLGMSAAKGLNFNVSEGYNSIRYGAPGQWSMDITANNASQRIDIGASGTGTLVPALSVLNTGNVGIGTTSPSSMLDVLGNIKLGDGSNETTIYYNTPTSGNPNLVLVPSTANKAGVVVLTPSTDNLIPALMIRDKTLAASGGHNFIFGTGYSSVPANTWNFASTIDGDPNAASWPIGFLVSNASAGRFTAMTILNSGNVGIGTTGPTARLSVKGTGATNATYGLLVTDSNDVSNMYVNDDGSGYLKAAAWTYGSDKRIKENIDYLSGGLEKIMALKPASFDYIGGVKNNLGFIAQDVQAVIPEAVVVTNPLNGLLGLKTDFILPYLVSAVQEQQNQITGITIELGSLVHNQNEIVEQLTGQLADQNLSLSEKLTIIGANLDNLNKEQYDKQLKKIKDQLEDNIDNLETLQKQYASLGDQFTAVLDFLTVSDGTLDLGKTILKAASIETTILTAKEALFKGEVVAGVFAVKAADEESKTVGQVVICKINESYNSEAEECKPCFEGEICDGKSVIVETKAVSKDSRILLTPEEDLRSNSFWVSDIKKGESFNIKISDTIDKEVIFNWWIVEEK